MICDVQYLVYLFIIVFPLSLVLHSALLSLLIIIYTTFISPSFKMPVMDGLEFTSRLRELEATEWATSNTTTVNTGKADGAVGVRYERQLIVGLVG